MSWDIVSAASALHADKVALICGVTHKQVTHREFVVSVKAIAASLAQRGVTKGTVRKGTMTYAAFTDRLP
ncbi:hypothetical protein DYB34_009518 [Aphanomyces astaci]|uniref:AMP-dependent synthetase/ligase domain-containing protein n=1 Tax=Aphanomyces astaci TaxID=112090 RepID=A0A3R7A6R9_APHAT|nr:hypothetical protein DYB34_009518 [Aphanomyces astaci]